MFSRPFSIVALFPGEKLDKKFSANPATLQFSDSGGLATGQNGELPNNSAFAIGSEIYLRTNNKTAIGKKKVGLPMPDDQERSRIILYKNTT